MSKPIYHRVLRILEYVGTPEFIASSVERRLVKGTKTIPTGTIREAFIGDTYEVLAEHEMDAIREKRSCMVEDALAATYGNEVEKKMRNAKEFEMGGWIEHYWPNLEAELAKANVEVLADVAKRMERTRSGGNK
ncbi:MAG: hypothetical protein KGL39_16005 [Patescibacteria group bacterium]|nr:hypothetical protein [Patescibacteria group bacterium]